MTEEEIKKRVRKVLAHEFELEEAELKPEVSLYEDLELDSLDAVDMVVALEKAFAMKMTDQEALREVATIQDLFDFLIEMAHETNNEIREDSGTG
ncbi:MAG: acyl carrier protein [Desulfurivibrionaceae bacterium]